MGRSITDRLACAAPGSSQRGVFDIVRDEISHRSFGAVLAKDRMRKIPVLAYLAILAALAAAATTAAAATPVAVDGIAPGSTADAAIRRSKSCPGGCSRSAVSGIDGAEAGSGRASARSLRSESKVGRATSAGSIRQPGCPGGCTKHSRRQDDALNASSASTRAGARESSRAARTARTSGKGCPGGCGKTGLRNGANVMR